MHQHCWHSWKFWCLSYLMGEIRQGWDTYLTGKKWNDWKILGCLMRHEMRQMSPNYKIRKCISLACLTSFWLVNELGQKRKQKKELFQKKLILNSAGSKITFIWPKWPKVTLMLKFWLIWWRQVALKLWSRLETCQGNRRKWLSKCSLILKCVCFNLLNSTTQRY